MSDAPYFLTKAHVFAIHRRVIDEFGGNPGVRDHGLLESAVRMPAARFAGVYLHDGIPAMAAAYLFHLCKNHAFMDGNKRVALASAEVFLLLNERQLNATDDELEVLTVAVASGRVSKQEVTEFFSDHVTPEND